MDRSAVTARRAPAAWAAPLSRALTGLSLLLLIGMLAYLALRTLPVMWLDEAMLYLALHGVSSPAGLVRPLPLYDQAAPLGFSALSYLLFRVTESVAVLKIPVLLASLLTVAAVWRAQWRPGGSLFWPFLAAALLLAETNFAFLFGNYKPYIFEILALATFVLGLAEPRWRWPALIVSGLTALLFGNVAPMLVVALGAVALYRRRWRELALAAALGAVYVAFYFLFIRQSVSLQFLAFSYIYEQGFFRSLTEYVAGVGRVFGSLLPDIPTRRGDALQLACGALFALGFVTSLVRRTDLALSLLAVGLFLSALSFLGVYPWLPDRYSLFLLPFVVALTVEGLRQVVGWAGGTARFRALEGSGVVRSVAVPLATLALLLGAGALFVRRGENHVRTGELPYAHLLAARQAAAQRVIPFFILQPQVQAAAEVLDLPARSLEETDDRSSFGLTAGRGAETTPSSFTMPGSWSALLIAEQSKLGWMPRELSLGNYVRWVVDQAGASDRVALILPRCYPHLDPDARALVARLSERHTVRELRVTDCFQTLLFSRQP